MHDERQVHDTCRIMQEGAKLKAEQTALQAKKKADEAERMRQQLLAAQAAADAEAARVSHL